MTKVYVVYYDYQSDEGCDSPECVFDSETAAQKFISDNTEPWSHIQHWQYKELELNTVPDWRCTPK